jgi:hypothetical protein
VRMEMCLTKLISISYERYSFMSWGEVEISDVDIRCKSDLRASTKSIVETKMKFSRKKMNEILERTSRGRR